MEKAVERVESLFQEAESRINYLSRKLEFEFENNEDVKVNPAEMTRKIEEVKKEYAAAVQEAAAIQHAQKDAVEQFKTQLGATCSVLQKLQDGSGTMTDEKLEELTKLEALLGIEVPESIRPKVTQSSSVSEMDSGSKAAPAVTKENLPSNCEDFEESAGFMVSAASRRLSGDEYIEVTKGEFETVSELVRGRVKLSELNKVYQILWRHFKEEKNSNPLSTADMHTLGLKIAGTTGQAKLKVLRSLKLLKISTKGDVTLV